MVRSTSAAGGAASEAASKEAHVCGLPPSVFGDGLAGAPLAVGSAGAPELADPCADNRANHQPPGQQGAAARRIKQAARAPHRGGCR